MLQRLLEQKRVLAVIALDYTACPALQEINYSTLEEVMMVLQQFDTLTTTLSSRAESISSAIPAYYASLRALAISPGDSQVIIDLKSSIKAGLEGRMAEHLGTPALVVATVVDPRYKLRCFPSEADRRQAKAMLEFELDMLQRTAEGEEEG
jgi:hypothetical protein